MIAELFDHDKSGEILPVPEGYEFVAAIPAGVPAVAAKKCPPRKELRKFLHKEKFGVKDF